MNTTKNPKLGADLSTISASSIQPHSAELPSADWPNVLTGKGDHGAKTALPVRADPVAASPVIKSNSSLAFKHPRSDATGEVLLIKADEVCRRLGGLSRRSLSRMEERGIVRSLPLLRHKLYSVAEINKLVEGMLKW